MRVTFTDDDGNQESLTSGATSAVKATNRPATGAPSISGTAQVGKTLTASISGISDADGLDDVAYSYQWVRNDGDADSDIQGATSSTYELVDADQGKTMRVRVSFEDDADNQESLTSAATSSVKAANRPAAGAPVMSGTARVGETLTASTSAIVDEDGLDNASFSYQWIRGDSDIEDATSSTYQLVDADQGETIKVRVSFTDDADNAESLTSAATAVVAARPNRPATGQPTISGTAQVGETLTASTSGIADEDGLSDAAYSYQWLADGTAISGAHSSTYTLSNAEQGKAIGVRVSFTDGRGHSESLTSAATGAVSPATPLTASYSSAPSSHNGSDAFTLELRFSENVRLSYKNLRDHGFQVTGGTVTRAKRLDKPSNVRWEIHVQPDGNGDVTIVLPKTADCDDAGAICTADGTMLSNRNALTVVGPNT